MYEYNKVINGIATFIDEEILTSINGWQKWVLGSGIGIALSDAEELFNSLKNNELIKMLKIVDGDKVNVDKIYKKLKKQAKKSSITFNIPMIGTLTLKEEDVDKLKEIIERS